MKRVYVVLIFVLGTIPLIFAQDLVPSSISVGYGLTETVFPNPSIGKIAITGFEQIETVELYNLLGERVLQITNFDKLATNQIDLTGFENGIYYLKMYSGTKMKTEKLVLQQQFTKL